MYASPRFHGYHDGNNDDPNVDYQGDTATYRPNSGGLAVPHGYTAVPGSPRPVEMRGHHATSPQIDMQPTSPAPYINAAVSGNRQSVGYNSPRDNPFGAGTAQPVGFNAPNQYKPMPMPGGSIQYQGGNAWAGTQGSPSSPHAYSGQPAPYSQTQTSPAQAHGGFAPPAPQSPAPGTDKAAYGRMKDQHAALQKRIDDMRKLQLNPNAGFDPKVIVAAEAERTALEQKMWGGGGEPAGNPGSPLPSMTPGGMSPYISNPDSRPAPTWSGSPQQQPSPPAPQVYINPQTGNPQMHAPITDANRIHVDKSSPEYQQSIRTMYDSAAQGAKRQAQEIQDTPTMQPGDEARRAVAHSTVDASYGGATQANAVYKGAQMTGDVNAMAGARMANQGRLDARAQAQAQAKDLDTRAANSTPEAIAGRKQALAENENVQGVIAQRQNQFREGNYNIQQQTKLTQDNPDHVAIAQRFMQKAGGDADYARKLAQQAGYQL